MSDDYTTHALHFIQVHLEAGVPEEIRRIEQRGGISADDFERVRGNALYLATHGDASHDQADRKCRRALILPRWHLDVRPRLRRASDSQALPRNGVGHLSTHGGRGVTSPLCTSNLLTLQKRAFSL